MSTIMHTLIGLVAGYVFGIVVAAVVAFAFGMEDAARIIAIAFGVLGALTGPAVARRLDESPR
jgi:phosphate/sulfate permease